MNKKPQKVIVLLLAGMLIAAGCGRQNTASVSETEKMQETDVAAEKNTPEETRKTEKKDETEISEGTQEKETPEPAADRDSNAQNADNSGQAQQTEEPAEAAEQAASQSELTPSQSEPTQPEPTPSQSEPTQPEPAPSEPTQPEQAPSEPTQPEPAPSEPESVEPVSYSPQRVVELAVEQIKALGKIYIPDDLNQMLASGELSQEDYNSCYPTDGAGYLEYYVATDMNEARDISGTVQFSSEADIAANIAGMYAALPQQYFYIEYHGTTMYGDRECYVFYCYRA